MTRHILSLLLLFSLTACLSASPSRLEGVVHGHHVWSGQVEIAGDVILAPDTHIEILPGTEVVFLAPDVNRGTLTEHPHFPGSELIVQGTLRARGTADRPIVFRSADPDAPAGSWGAVNIEQSPQVIFEYCIFRQADSAVHSRESTVYIEQCLFEQNLVGVRFHSSEMLLENSLLRNNDVAIRFHFGAPVVCNNIFTGNRVNLFITSHPRDYHMENNIFHPAAEYQVVLGENVPDDVQLRSNYWPGTPHVKLIETFYDGRRVDYLGRVLFEPSLPDQPSLAGPAWIR